MSKKYKVEKETRRLMESMADLVRKKGSGYKFKSKGKKAIKKILQKFLQKADTKGKIIEPFQELTLILSLSKAL